MPEMGDRYRWGQHRVGDGWWVGTDRLKNRKLETLPMRGRVEGATTPADALRALVSILEIDNVAVLHWEAL